MRCSALLLPPLLVLLLGWRSCRGDPSSSTQSISSTTIVVMSVNSPMAKPTTASLATETTKVTASSPPLSGSATPSPLGAPSVTTTAKTTRSPSSGSTASIPSTPTTPSRGATVVPTTTFAGTNPSSPVGSGKSNAPTVQSPAASSPVPGVTPSARTATKSSAFSAVSGSTVTTTRISGTDSTKQTTVSPSGGPAVPTSQTQDPASSKTSQMPSAAPSTETQSASTPKASSSGSLPPKATSPGGERPPALTLAGGGGGGSSPSTSSPPVHSQIICEGNLTKNNKAVMLTLNESIPCDHVETSRLKEPLFNLACSAVKPTFNRSRDECALRLASVAEDPHTLAILGVSVKTNSIPEELFVSLSEKKGELEKIGVSNITHEGRTLDLDMKDTFTMPLIITIVCMAASLLLVAAIYGCCHQRISQRKDQRLTEELQTMENGYHDNPTLEVMETTSEMQEKKVKLNGELGDSWIVPMANLTKEELEEEEDTHL
ncbi:podocalyxin isoform X2 [Hemicordylus capensis]|uniref:podocalyxin isoform X2 n=1 Tax=Hemicordylus capensis TaxID=884348 RepID=UPI002303EC4D|nr:podocalyxin isoform X2 [Hemicordylus capensis]